MGYVPTRTARLTVMISAGNADMGLNAGDAYSSGGPYQHTSRTSGLTAGNPDLLRPAHPAYIGSLRPSAPTRGSPGQPRSTPISTTLPNVPVHYGRLLVVGAPTRSTEHAGASRPRDCALLRAVILADSKLRHAEFAVSRHDVPRASDVNPRWSWCRRLGRRLELV